MNRPAASAPERVQLITDFEPFIADTLNGQVVFQSPTNSVTTRHFINSVTNVGKDNLAAVTDTYPPGGPPSGHVLRVTCDFTNASNPWLRLTTAGTATLPNPVIDFTKKLRFHIRADRDVRIGLGCRETTTAAGTAVGFNGGTSGAIEWVGVTNVSGTAPVPTRTVPANVWTTLVFDFPNEPIRNFSGGNGILSTASGLGVLEHLAIVPMDGLGVYNVYLDHLAVVGPAKLTFSLGPNAPDGASIHPTTGVFTWTPSPAQALSTNLISVIVADDSVPPLRATNSFTVIVRQDAPTSPPLLSPLENRTVAAGHMHSFTNYAYDSNPIDVLTFSLDPGAPPGASIDPVTGIFTWTPGDADTNSVHYVTVRVTDDGSPPMSGTATFAVTVEPAPPPNHGPLLFPIGGFTVHAGMLVTFTNIAYDPNPGDTLTFNLDPGAPPGAAVNAASGVFSWIPGEAEAGSVHSMTVRVTDDGYPPLSGSAGFSVTVQPRPAMQNLSLSDGAATLAWSAIPGVTYRVQYKNNLDDPHWEPLGGDVNASGSVATAQDHRNGESPQRFYRVMVVE